jgi:hypothetical protein
VDSINIYNKNRDQHNGLNIPYAAMVAPAGLAGLQIDTNKQALLDTTAWFWTAKAKQAKISRGNVFIDSVPSVDFDASKGKYNTEKQTYSSGNQFYSTKTVGGFIFITRASLGKVDFYLHGVISRNKEGKYIMTPLQHNSIKIVSNTGNLSEQPDTKELKKDNKISEIKEP